MRFIKEHKLAVFIIAATLAAAITIGALGAKSGSASTAERVGGDIVSGPQGVISSIGRFFGGLTTYFGNVKALTSENEKLKNENSNLQKQINDMQGLEDENSELRQMLKLQKGQPDINMQAASVSAKDPSDWYATLTIDKGSRDGIKENQPVVNSNRELVGQISRVGDNWADVITITDPQSSVGAVIKRSKAIGIIEGNSELRYEGKCRLGYISRDTNIQEGDYIETSGLGGIYPKGLIIGTVESIYDENSTMSKAATIKPCANIAKLNEVFVIISYKQADLSATETTTKKDDDKADSSDKSDKSKNSNNSDSDSDKSSSSSSSSSSSGSSGSSRSGGSGSSSRSSIDDDDN